ncbi:GNAT family N-acetyltransferase [Vreelandella boliviensis]|uniref:GNAT family N-acetyltransferase n=1 Tax=Vreelandella boliviensis TaxID=223527 RepID=UPI001B8CFD63|nr:GNAT family N-acetyltransferase [Halomonas boliviensis]MBS3667585.1 GNAT family N-acetyltransferase [Halomonas boliviensis]
MTDSPSAAASASVPARFEREDLTWRPMTVNDLEAAHSLSHKLGWPHRIDDWRQMLDVGEGVALESVDGELMGTGLCFNQGAVATLGLVVINDDWQGLGLGREMMVRLMALAGPRTLLLVATKAGQPLYQKLGFEPCNRICQYQGGVTLAPPVPLLPGLRAMQASDQAALLALSPDSLAHAVAVQSANRGVVIENAGAIEGFALKRTYGRGEHIGPILARSAEQAQALVLALLTDAEGDFIRIDLVDPYDDSWLTALGLNCVDQITRMRCGEAVEEGPLTRFGLLTQALG